MREQELLTHIFSRTSSLSREFPHVLAGPGDDCAVVRAADATLLLKVDQLVAHRHFTPGTPWDAVARKALARPLSDIAATGGTPIASLGAATFPAGFPRHDALALCDALHAHAAAFACPMVGGDIASHADAHTPLVLSITILATPHPRRGPVLRSGARPGDALYVTGSLGGSLDRITGAGKHLTFTPRLAEAAWLADTLGPDLHAMMDISDGLGIDCSRLARASRVALELDAPNIPITPGCDLDRALSDGEDYELLFAVAPGRELPSACPRTATPITRIGIATPHDATPVLVRLAGGGTLDASTMGWEHR